MLYCTPSVGVCVVLYTTCVHIMHVMVCTCGVVYTLCRWCYVYIVSKQVYSWYCVVCTYMYCVVHKVYGVYVVLYIRCMVYMLCCTLGVGVCVVLYIPHWWLVNKVHLQFYLLPVTISQTSSLIKSSCINISHPISSKWNHHNQNHISQVTTIIRVIDHMHY